MMNEPTQIAESSLRLGSEDLPQLLDNADTAEQALSRAKALWFFGDWQSLASISRKEIETHPERGRLALLVASANSQTGNDQKARELVRAALDWDCPPRLIAQVLAAGVHNSLGRAAALKQDEQRLKHHFSTAVATVAGAEQAELVSQARAVREMSRLGLMPQAAQLLDTALTDAQAATGLRPLQKQAGLDALKREMALLRSEVTSLQQTRSALPADQSEETKLSAEHIQRLAQSCLEQSDPLASIDHYLDGDELTKFEKFQLAVALSDLFFELDDGLNGQNYLAQADRFIVAGDSRAAAQRRLLSRRLAQKGRIDRALDLAVLNIASELDLPENRSNQLLGMYRKLREPEIKRGEHGHDLLLSRLEKMHQAGAPLKGKLLIEIGSTREDVPGQGSTAKIAAFCAQHQMRFITVDMDPHNTKAASRTLEPYEQGFEAISQKGEDFLREYQGKPDYVFLDAYDFDHGKHSAVRQNRYVQFMGSGISDAACHQMHLDCAESLVDKLAPDGLICIDDTWQEQGEWTHKGKLAVPFLLHKGFKLIEARNKAAILQRNG